MADAFVAPSGLDPTRVSAVLRTAVRLTAVVRLGAAPFDLAAGALFLAAMALAAGDRLRVGAFTWPVSALRSSSPLP